MTIEDVARRFTELQVDDHAGFEGMAEVVLDWQCRFNAAYIRYRSRVLSPWDPAPEGQAWSTRTPRAYADHATGSPPPASLQSKPGRADSLPIFLPVEAFGHARIATFPPEPGERVFLSSRTGSGTPSRHAMHDLSTYERSLLVHFGQVFGRGPFLFACCLPGYVEQGSTSSLLYMVECLIEQFGMEASGSFLGAPAKLRQMAARSLDEGVPLVIFGAAFGLLDFLDGESCPLPQGSLVIETGGMKTHRREIARADLHRRLAAGFGIAEEAVYSEYGMCELSSQCYTRGGSRFYPPPWMRVWIVDPAWPFEPLPEGQPGALAVLDLANLYSASALLTQDRAVRRGDGFEVLGRLEGADLRGCNFLLEDV